MMDNWMIMILNKVKGLGTKFDSQSDKIDEVNTKIGTTSDTGGSATAGTIMSKLNGIFTNSANAASYASTASSRANNAVSNTATNNTASKTGILSQKLAYIISLLEGSSSSSGGVVRHIQRGKSTATYGLTTQISLSGFTDLDKMVVIINGIITSNSGGGVLMNDLSTTKLFVGSSSSSTNISFSYQVIEFY